MPKKLYLHIGYPRTATKTFQNHFFPFHPDINYLGRHPIRKELGSTHIDIINTLMILPDEVFDHNKNFILSEIENLQLSENKINLISTEFFILSECLYEGFYDLDENKKIKKAWFGRKKEINKKSHIKLENSISRLQIIMQELKIELKIFFSIREQFSEILSLYTTSAPEGGNSFPLSVNLFFENIKNQNLNFFVGNFLETFNYKNKYEILSKIIGEKNLKVLVYEDLKYKKNFFLEELSNFLNIDVNTSKNLLNKNFRDNSTDYIINEKTEYNSIYKIILGKFKKNIIHFHENLNANILKKKIFNLLLFIKMIFAKKKNNYLSNKKNLIDSRLQFEKNITLIRKIYRKDNELFDKKNHLNLKNYNYY